MSLTEVKSKLQTEVHSQLIRYYAGVIVIVIVAIVAFFAGGAFSTFRDFTSINTRVYALEETTSGIPVIIDSLDKLDDRLSDIEVSQDTMLKLLQIFTTK